ncbi:hypothetical protein GCM10023094_28720 [Rhodococcus olei]|uniref:Uncharacterized protein n=1 Tax=Rhodococcus olei TaxID=2161675 RepID=A0ABP8P632_9NOCA
MFSLVATSLARYSRIRKQLCFKEIRNNPTTRRPDRPADRPEQSSPRHNDPGDAAPGDLPSGVMRALPLQEQAR